ncbi:MAG: hypothetical protein CVT92_06635 [Bacteroidetes bacterium HGW-Bacteroidetes-1]|jgi:FKBP-type peptidyl-prolyl cis-trans isomerase|nr:MAG: hypothetical protein CVT92_06635 [Bacteroidetes bacterium HGW-Bacteroidetes-1]
MKGKSLIFIAAITFAGITTACSQISNGSYKETDSGLKYKFIRQSDDSEKPKVTDIVTATMAYYINDSLLFDSKNMGKPIQFPLSASAFKGDFFEGLAMMGSGDSASFLCRADSIFLKVFRVKSLPGFVVPDAMMRFEIGLDTFMTQQAFETQKYAQAQEEVVESSRKLEQYIKDNGITVQPQASGLYYIETQKGTGKKPHEGERVKVHYKGTLLDGTKFDASYDRNQPFDFVLGMGQVIKGWDEGIALMQEGGKATLILPFNLAYGERATGQIPAFSPLIFEVEFIEIIK